jgi:tyrosine-protein kinase Etk/Wzc
MNARNNLHTSLVQSPAGGEEDQEIGLAEYWDILVDNRWMVAIIAATTLAIGLGYAFLSRPVFETNLLIQVEDSAGSTTNLFGDAATPLLDIKSPAAAEMEILKSRLVVGQAVDNTLLYISARPRYLPLVGNWMARHAHGLSNPGFLGIGGYVTGAEKIAVSKFDVPQALEGSRFQLIAGTGGEYELSNAELISPLKGRVGAQLQQSTPVGAISLLVTKLDGKPGAAFDLTRASRLRTIENVQGNLKLTEKGNKSGVIDATLQSTDPVQLVTILNEIGHQYVRQNIERKAAEAEKQLAFLNVQMPLLKKQLDQAEEAYSRFRNQKGTVDLDEEAKDILGQEVDLQSKLLDAKQKRLELIARFTNQHPVVKTLDEQIATWNQQIAVLHARIARMPAVQQDAYRLQRDASANNDAYQNLRNNVMQLQLIREGKVGNVRLIDDATLPEEPVQPKRPLAVALSCVTGILTGVLAALARNAMTRGIRSSQEIEAQTGLAVYSTIPLSSAQAALAEKAAARRPGVHVLATQVPHDAAIESLRSLRTALQFAMLETTNNRVLITGATPGVGKSFVSVNFSAIQANAGKRVLLIDSDLRKGHLNHFFGVPREGGLSELVAGTTAIEQAIRVDVLPNLDLLTTGILPPNPAELLMSASFATTLENLSKRYDLVIVDTPPVLVAADAAAVAVTGGTILLVARAGQTQTGELLESAKRLAHTGKAISGVLFNAIDMTRRYYGSYGYKYGGYRYRQYDYGR